MLQARSFGRHSLAAGLLAVCAAATTTASQAPDRPLFAKPPVLGASLSAGYGLRSELDAKVDLGDLLECVLGLEAGSVTRAADLWFFTRPRQLGPQFIEEIRESTPSVVFALDFLFWFPFGPESSEEKRMEELEFGLGLLDTLSCPIVVADFPDVTLALEGRGPFGAPVVTAELLPKPETLVALNERLREWAAQRGDVVVTPMAEFARKLRAGEEIRIAENCWPENSLERLVQADLLHPTSEGAVGLLLLAMQQLSSQRDDFDGEGVDWEASSVRERLLERTASEREERARRDQKRKEKRRARDTGGDEERDAA
jgi:hypothetical protein